MRSSFRYFLTYCGPKLPVRLVSPLERDDVDNRNTYIRAQYDAADRLIAIEKVVYGEVELTHHYQYDEAGALRSAEVIMGGERSILKFD